MNEVSKSKQCPSRRLRSAFSCWELTIVKVCLFHGTETPKFGFYHKISRLVTILATEKPAVCLMKSIFYAIPQLFYLLRPIFVENFSGRSKQVLLYLLPPPIPKRNNFCTCMCVYVSDICQWKIPCLVCV